LTVGKLRSDAGEVWRQLSTREHLARQVLDGAASGHRPSRDELDAVVALAKPEQREDFRRRFSAACSEAAEVFGTGAQGSARALAKEAAFALADDLEPDRRRREDLSGLGPAELAAHIRRV
jgi:hypothetical protein